MGVKYDTKTRLCHFLIALVFVLSYAILLPNFAYADEQDASTSITLQSIVDEGLNNQDSESEEIEDTILESDDSSDGFLQNAWLDKTGTELIIFVLAGLGCLACVSSLVVSILLFRKK